MSNTQSKQTVEPKKEAKPRKPNETGSISVQAHMRIYDPKTQKTYVEGRA
jgi:hypothetical protein